MKVERSEKEQRMTQAQYEIRGGGEGRSETAFPDEYERRTCRA